MSVTTHIDIIAAKDRLVQLFEEKKLCYWQSGEDQGSFRITLSWPDMDKANFEIVQITEIIDTFNSEYVTVGLRLANSQPIFSAGGVYVVYLEIRQ